MMKEVTAGLCRPLSSRNPADQHLRHHARHNPAFGIRHQIRSGVQRQYSGTAGRIENCQLGVFLTYASSKGRALIDRELYLPVSWTDDRDRCGEAGIGEEVEFATKPELARRMLERARDAEAVFGWFTADEAYGDNPGLRTWLEAQDINYVMAISCDQRFSTPTGRLRADELAVLAPTRGWQRLSGQQRTAPL